MQKNLEAKLARIAGFDVEITIRGDREFTLSAEGDRDFGKVLEFFQNQKLAGVSRIYDSECDLTCLYFTID